MESISSNTKKKRSPLFTAYVRLWKIEKSREFVSSIKIENLFNMCVDRVTLENVTSKGHYDEYYSIIEEHSAR